MPKNKPSLSVVLATHNEEQNLSRCLQAVKDIADEIVIVDGSSTDTTRAIAKSFGARVIKTSNKPNFHINKKKAINAAQSDWILLLDADEVVTPALAKEIGQIIKLTDQQIKARHFSSAKQRLFTNHLKAVQSRDGDFPRVGETVAFFLPRLNMFLGKPLKYGGVYPDGVIRLVKKGKANLPAKDVHEQFKVDGQVGWLQNDLLHYDSPTFSRYFSRHNRYTSLTAQNLKKQRLPINLASTFNYLIFKPLFTFLKLYFRHKGFLDGFPGFIWALFSALHHPIAYFKYWELHKKTT